MNAVHVLYKEGSADNWLHYAELQTFILMEWMFWFTVTLMS